MNRILNEYNSEKKVKCPSCKKLIVEWLLNEHHQIIHGNELKKEGEDEAIH